MSQTVEISREELYEKIWATPIDHLAKEFGVSGSYLARVCSALNVPRPPVGYWQKKAVGKARPRPALPVALPGDQLSWSKDTALAALIRSFVRRKKKDAGSVQSSRHPLLVGVEAHYRKSRTTEENEFLRPYKFLLPDIVASEACLTRALDLADEAYRALDRAGHRVVLAPPHNSMHRPDIEERETPGKDRHYGRYGSGVIWSPHRPTLVYIEDMPIGLALTEMTERVTLRYLNGKYVREDSKVANSIKPWQHSWTTQQDLPCGRFRLVAYAPFHGVAWLQCWQETPQASLRPMIPRIVQKLEGSIGELQRLKKAADEATAQRQREHEEQWQRYLREEDKRKVAEAHMESRKQLAGIMDRWAVAISVERFFEEADRRLERVEGESRTEIQERLALARSMLGALDPLDFLKEWRAPAERYKSKYDPTSAPNDHPREVSLADDDRGAGDAYGTGSDEAEPDFP
jgi:hypothetical protein